MINYATTLCAIVLYPQYSNSRGQVWYLTHGHHCGFWQAGWCYLSVRSLKDETDGNINQDLTLEAFNWVGEYWEGLCSRGWSSFLSTSHLITPLPTPYSQTHSNPKDPNPGLSWRWTNPICHTADIYSSLHWACACMCVLCCHLRVWVHLCLHGSISCQRGMPFYSPWVLRAPALSLSAAEAIFSWQITKKMRSRKPRVADQEQKNERLYIA